MPHYLLSLAGQSVHVQHLAFHFFVHALMVQLPSIQSSPLAQYGLVTFLWLLASRASLAMLVSPISGRPCG
jgi:hypothetical protein